MGTVGLRHFFCCFVLAMPLRKMFICVRIWVMEEYFVTVGTCGEIDIPAAIRESLGIVEGTRLAFRPDGARIVVEIEKNAASDISLNE